MADAYTNMVQAQARIARIKAENADIRREEKMANIGLAGKAVTGIAKLRKDVIEKAKFGEKTAEGLQKFTMKTDGGFGTAIRRAFLPMEQDFELTSAGKKDAGVGSAFQQEMSGTSAKIHATNFTNPLDKTLATSKDIGFSAGGQGKLRDSKSPFRAIEGMQSTVDGQTMKGYEVDTRMQLKDAGFGGKHSAKAIDLIGGSPSTGKLRDSKSSFNTIEGMNSTIDGAPVKKYEIDTMKQLREAGFGGKGFEKAIDLKDTVAPIADKTSMLSSIAGKAGGAINALSVGKSALSLVGGGSYNKNPIQREAERNQNIGNLVQAGVTAVNPVAGLAFAGGRGLYNLLSNR